jgi:endonuclease YncB( thermonuclease family)
MKYYTLLDIVGRNFKNPYVYACECIRVLDGDTVELEVDLGFNIKKRDIFRLDGYDAPETHRPLTNAERIGGERCTALMVKLVRRGNLFVQSLYKGIYGRMGGRLFYWDTEKETAVCINDLLEDYIRENNMSKEVLRKEKD